MPRNEAAPLNNPGKLPITGIAVLVQESCRQFFLNQYKSSNAAVCPKFVKKFVQKVVNSKDLGCFFLIIM